MPHIDLFRCNKCDFQLPTGSGYYLYVENNKGKRIPCPHPAERERVEKVLGKEASEELIFERIGFNSRCVCLDCLYQFEADLGVFPFYWSPFHFRTVFLDTPRTESNRKFVPKQRLPIKAKDKRECPKCKSQRVQRVLQLISKNCPKCKDGVIERVWTGLIS